MELPEGYQGYSLIAASEVRGLGLWLLRNGERGFVSLERDGASVESVVSPDCRRARAHFAARLAAALACEEFGAERSQLGTKNLVDESLKEARAACALLSEGVPMRVSEMGRQIGYLSWHLSALGRRYRLKLVNEWRPDSLDFAQRLRRVRSQMAWILGQAPCPSDRKQLSPADAFVLERIRSRRLELELCPSQAARRCGLEEDLYRCLESGNAALTLSRLFRVLCGLQLSLERAWPVWPLSVAEGRKTADATRPRFVLLAQQARIDRRAMWVAEEFDGLYALGESSNGFELIWAEGLGYAGSLFEARVAINTVCSIFRVRAEILGSLSKEEAEVDSPVRKAQAALSLMAQQGLVDGRIASSEIGCRPHTLERMGKGFEDWLDATEKEFPKKARDPQFRRAIAIFNRNRIHTLRPAKKSPPRKTASLDVAAGKAIASRRKQHGMSLLELACRSGLSERYCRGLEEGRYGFTPQTLWQMLTPLGLKTEDAFPCPLKLQAGRDEPVEETLARSRLKTAQEGV